MRWLATLVVAGCGFRGPPSGVASDGAIDTGTVLTGDAGSSCFGTAPFAVCVPTPTMPLAVAGSIDTSPTTTGTCAGTGSVASLSGTLVCVLAGTTVTVQGTQVTGAFPLVIASADTIAVTGTLDASSHGAASAGPGASASPCGDLSMTSGTNSAASAGGGSGGSFGGAGGRGGNGMTAAPGGIPRPAVMGVQEVLRGGCGGGPGGAGTDPNKARGGDGGGALYLVARTSITITGAVDASGGGGAGGVQIAGGAGGGGSGGMIVLAAPVVDATSGVIFANGGGGGGGAGTGTDGKAGADPTTPGSAAAPGAAGDHGATGGGTGGHGVVDGAGATMSSAGGGAGGGGGGIGVIRPIATTFAATSISPPPS